LLEEALGFFVCIVDFEEEHLVDAGSLLELLCGVFASGGEFGLCVGEFTLQGARVDQAFAG
jgi:hypothetical protein